MGCRTTAHPAQFVRIARAPGGELVIGPGPGRGAWLCGPPRTAECFAQAVRRQALARALRTGLSRRELEGLRAKLLGQSD